jgi:repressor LexA
VTRHDAERKQKIIECIARTVAERGYPPSVREIADAVGLASTSAVHHHLTSLEREGLLERGSHSSRALRLTARGEAELEATPRRATSRVTPFRMPVERDVLSLPVLGEIAAGQPIEAYDDGAESLDVPRSMQARDDSYVLRVRGKSMIDALIDDGDYVVVQPQATARDGDIVVALLGTTA